MAELEEKHQAVERMQELIEQCITEPITLRMLADASGYSPWHAARVFKEQTGKNPFDYIRELRLSRAAERLLNGDEKIIDVAFDFVFETHEGFTRAFSRQFGVNPRKFQKEKPAVKLFMPEKIRDCYHKIKRGELTMSTNQNTVFVQVVDRPARKLIIKRGITAKDYFAYCEELGCDVFEELKSVKEAIYEPMGLWLPKNMQKQGTSEYAMGVEVPVNFVGEVPQGYEIIELKPCKMMIFQGQPYDDNNFMQAISDIWSVMKTYNPEIYGFQWADNDAPRFQLEPQGYRGYIEGRPVRELNK
jgi:AraC-like DNA-binding protein